MNLDLSIYGDTSDASWKRIKKHIKARKEILSRVPSIARANFGADRDLSTGIVSQSTFACAEACRIAFSGMEQQVVKSKYFAPGDSGYIINHDHQEHGGADEGETTQGENLIYMGGASFFGHIDAPAEKKYRSIDGWIKHVSRWGRASLWAGRTIPTKDVDKFHPAASPSAVESGGGTCIGRHKMINMKVIGLFAFFLGVFSLQALQGEVVTATWRNTISIPRKNASSNFAYIKYFGVKGVSFYIDGKFVGENEDGVEGIVKAISQMKNGSCLLLSLFSIDEDGSKKGDWIFPPVLKARWEEITRLTDERKVMFVCAASRDSFLAYSKAFEAFGAKKLRDAQP